jgi:glycosyltransferase involved in cell wall biosynthesis
LQKSICIAFLGNALHDSRIVNLTNSLKEDNCRVQVISFDWFISNQSYFDQTYSIYKLEKKNSLLFYLKYAFILINQLLRTKADIYFAEDFYTLPFVTIIAKLKRAKVYYNSRELYAFIGGLRNRPFLQSVVKAIEKLFITRVDIVLTTGEMDSHFIENFYGIKNTLVIRNVPLLRYPDSIINFRGKYNLPVNSFILLYQGVLLEGRGIPLVLKAMKRLPKTVLIILGNGEQKKNFQKLSEEYGLVNRVIFAGTIQQHELVNYTAGADLGLTLIENISVSYYHALPNKLFEYIMAGLPVLSSDLPQMKRIVETYNVGEAISIKDETGIVKSIQHIIDNPDQLKRYRENCLSAAKELNWQEEYKKVRRQLLESD